MVFRIDGKLWWWLCQCSDILSVRRARAHAEARTLSTQRYIIHQDQTRAQSPNAGIFVQAVASFLTFWGRKVYVRVCARARRCLWFVQTRTRTLSSSPLCVSGCCELCSAYWVWLVYPLPVCVISFSLICWKRLANWRLKLSPSWLCGYFWWVFVITYQTDFPSFGVTMLLNHPPILFFYMDRFLCTGAGVSHSFLLLLTYFLWFFGRNAKLGYISVFVIVLGEMICIKYEWYWDQWLFKMITSILKTKLKNHTIPLLFSEKAGGLLICSLEATTGTVLTPAPNTTLNQLFNESGPRPVTSNLTNVPLGDSNKIPTD